MSYCVSVWSTLLQWNFIFHFHKTNLSIHIFFLQFYIVRSICPTLSIWKLLHLKCSQRNPFLGTQATSTHFNVCCLRSEVPDRKCSYWYLTMHCVQTEFLRNPFHRSSFQLQGIIYFNFFFSPKTLFYPGLLSRKMFNSFYSTSSSEPGTTAIWYSFFLKAWRQYRIVNRNTGLGHTCGNMQGLDQDQWHPSE